MIITIDGPAGSGKSTAARNLARALGIAYLDTGATYRAVTLQALREGVDLSDAAALGRLARDMDLKLVPQSDGLRVLLDGQDVSAEIRSSRVSDNSHHVAASPEVRSVLVELQRRLGRKLGSFVSEGRDQGSVVFPQADVKFYLTADADARARRRREDLAASGESPELQEVREAILRRDDRDSSRAADPLVKPAGAIEIDTSARSIEETTAALLACVEAAG